MTARFLAVIFIVSTGSALLHRHSSRNETYEYNKFWIEKTHGIGRQKYTLLICGDSRVYRGISARAVASHLDNHTAFNFGYSSGSYSEFMLAYIDKHIDADVERPVLLLGITPYSLTPKAALDEHLHEELNRKKEEIVDYRYFKAIKNYFEPIDLERLIFGQTAIPPGEYMQDFRHNEGWVASSKRPFDTHAAIPEYTRDFANNRVSKEVTANLLARVTIWSERGFRVFAFRPPTTLAMVALENELSGFHEEQFVMAFEQAGGTWLPFDAAGYQTYDGSHLDGVSGLKFSHDLGKAVAEHLRTKALP